MNMRLIALVVIGGSILAFGLLALAGGYPDA